MVEREERPEGFGFCKMVNCAEEHLGTDVSEVRSVQIIISTLLKFEVIKSHLVQVIQQSCCVCTLELALQK